jgi:hypothetical protein
MGETISMEESAVVGQEMEPAGSGGEVTEVD